MEEKSVKEIVNALNKSFENRIRLGIMSALMVNDSIDFLELKSLLDATDGNLVSHIYSLEKEKFISVKKSFVGRKTSTQYAVTTKGKKAFNEHLDNLEKIINRRK